MLNKGDTVIMHTCLEAKRYDGKIWTCKTDEFTAYSGASVVFLEGFVDTFPLNIYDIWKY
ncbi:hypothetical protein WAX78_16115 [Bacillus sp. FJAT-53711]|uniref:Uncharacterized protein n=1 Tax=Bacillus yunxiaonensis TaxID=3127665 RepID=A0ABU8G0R5_9BACI